MHWYGVSTWRWQNKSPYKFKCNAAGMGVKFKGLHNVLPYRPPSDLSTLVQQIDRAGRDGEFSVEMILYKNHNGHFKKKDNSVLILVKSEDQYRRNNFCQAYNAHSLILNTCINVVIFVKYLQMFRLSSTISSCIYYNWATRRGHVMWLMKIRLLSNISFTKNLP